MTFENDLLKIDINSSGQVVSILHKPSSYEFMTGPAAFSSVEDCLTNSLHGYGTDDIPEVNICHSVDKLVVSRLYKDSAIALKDAWRINGSVISWEVTAECSSNTPRTANVFLVIPLLGNDRHVFAAHDGAPFNAEDFRNLRFVYGGDQFRDELGRAVSLPLVTFYSEKEGAGITCASPAGQKVPAIWYSMFHESDNVGFVIKHCNFRMDKNHPVGVRILIHTHGGNWKEGLSWYHSRFHEYFTVKSSRIYDYEGSMLCSYNIHSADEISSWEEQDFTWQEIHAHIFPYYGMYSPTENEWDTLNARYSGSRLDLEMLRKLDPLGYEYDALGKNGAQMIASKDRIRDYIRLLHGYGVGAFVYVNPVLCDKSLVDGFVSSAARKEDGTYHGEGYYYGVSMNPDPDGAWGKHIISQVEGILHDYPECDGIFLDEIHYRHYDFAHDDGITMVHNKPCSMIGFQVVRLVEKICSIVHDRGKSVWANGPTSLEVMKYVDGFMAEASGTWMGIIQYYGIEKPMVLFCFEKTAEALEKIFAKALVCGGQKAVIPLYRISKDLLYQDKVRELFRKFSPLFKLTRGRKWVLDVNAVRLPEGVKGNCFEIRDGSHIIPVLTAKTIENAVVYINKSAVGVKSGACITPLDGYRSEPLKITEKEKWYALVVPELTGVAVIRIY